MCSMSSRRAVNSTSLQAVLQADHLQAQAAGTHDLDRHQEDRPEQQHVSKNARCWIGLRELPDVVGQPADALAEVLVGTGQADPHGALGHLPERAPRRDRDAALSQQLESEIAR